MSQFPRIHKLSWMTNSNELAFIVFMLPALLLTAIDTSSPLPIQLGGAAISIWSAYYNQRVIADTPNRVSRAQFLRDFTGAPVPGDLNPSEAQINRVHTYFFVIGTVMLSVGDFAFTFILNSISVSN